MERLIYRSLLGKSLKVLDGRGVNSLVYVDLLESAHFPDNKERKFVQ